MGTVRGPLWASVGLMLLCVISSRAASLAESARTSIVYIYFDVTDPKTGAKDTVQGTGFVISRDGYVLTAAHIFRKWKVQLDVDKKKNLIRGSLRDKPEYVSQSPLVMRVINPGDADFEDVALLKLPDPETGYPVAPICLTAPLPKAGDKLVAYGFPQNTNFQPVEGTVGTSNADGGRFAAAAPFVEGMSGGPVYDDRGFVFGLIKGGTDAIAVRWITPIRFAYSFVQIAAAPSSCI
jgi:S1-C subfamily serine protease